MQIGSIDYILVIYVLVGFVIILLGWIVRLEIKLRRLLMGKDSRSLEDTIVSAKKQIESLEEFEKDSLAYFADVEKRLGRSIQSVETVRFNPFKGIGEGGNQSFSTAFVSEKGDGVVVSSMYSRERVSVFSKPLHSFESQFELTEEEHHVIEEAKKKMTNFGNKTKNGN